MNALKAQVLSAGFDIFKKKKDGCIKMVLKPGMTPQSEMVH